MQRLRKKGVLCNYKSHGAAPLPGQQQRPLSYDSVSSCEKDTSYFLDVSYLLTKPGNSLHRLNGSIHTHALCYMDLTW